MKAIGYTRCSTQEQADSGLGLTAQTERIRAYCKMKGMALLGIVEDPGVSGGKPLADRDGGRELLSIIRKRQTDAVVMLKLDRMFRNAGDCLTTVERWEKASVALHIVDLGNNAIDTTSAAGRFMLVVLAGAAEMERNLVRERTKAAMGVKRANGERVGTLPFGYTLAADGVTLVPNDAEQETIGAIRTMRTEGLSFTKIAATLTAMGIPTKSGNGKKWNQATIRGILKRQTEMEQRT